MNRRNVFYGFSLLFAIINIPVVNAQNTQSKNVRTGNSKLIFSHGSRLYFNERDVNNDNVFPMALSANKPYSFNSQQSFLYQRTTAYGLMYGAGIETGNRSYSLSADFSSMELTDNPTQVYYVDYLKEYPFKTRYWGIKIFIGYSYDLNAINMQNWKMELTAGLCVTTQTKGYSLSEESVPIGYYLKDDDIVNITADQYIQWGKTDQGFGGPIVGELYLGISRNLRLKYLKDINLGLTFSHVAKYPSNNREIISQYGMSTVVTQYFYNGIKLSDRPNSIDSYTPSEMSIGVKCALGISWK